MLMSVSLRQDLFAMDRLIEEGEDDAAIKVVTGAKDKAKKKANQGFFTRKNKTETKSVLRKGHRMLAICDEDEVYRGRLAAYLTEHLSIPFEIREFTSVAKLLAYRATTEPTIVLIAGQLYPLLSSEVKTPFGDVIVLEDPDDVCYAEEGAIPAGRKISRVNKFGTTDRIVNAILDHCLSCSQVIRMGDRSDTRLQVIGVYSPLTRCLQSTTAASVAQLLGHHGKVLYLTLEPYPSLGEMQHIESEYDLSDFLYFFECYPTKTPLYLEKVKTTIGAMDVIPPAANYLSVKSVPAEKWEELFECLSQETDYAYVVLDLHEGMDAHMELLAMCDHVFTMQREDNVSAMRLEQYRATLTAGGFESVWDKTCRMTYPVFKNLPVRADDFHRGELAAYLRDYLVHTQILVQEGVSA